MSRLSKLRCRISKLSSFAARKSSEWSGRRALRRGFFLLFQIIPLTPLWLTCYWTCRTAVSSMSFAILRLPRRKSKKILFFDWKRIVTKSCRFEKPFRRASKGPGALKCLWSLSWQWKIARLFYRFLYHSALQRCKYNFCRSLFSALRLGDLVYIHGWLQSILGLIPWIFAAILRRSTQWSSQWLGGHWSVWQAWSWGNSIWSDSIWRCS